MNPELDDLLSITVKERASDLHITVGRYPTLRIEGRLVPLLNYKIVTSKKAEEIALALLLPEQKERFLKEKELDFSYSLKDIARFRVNVFYQRGTMSAALRLINQDVKTIEELALPKILHEFTAMSQGFFLVVGPSGQGKSTTLAAMIDEINKTRTEHIVTVEDPIEYLFTQDKSIVSQREVGIDTNDFHTALKSVLREDPDVIMVGEMRDPETISAAITAAETGHLVFSTLHTNNASQTIDRILDSFPSSQQNQVRTQLTMALAGVFSQRLVPRIKGGRIPAYEIMISNPAIKNLIRENKVHQIDLVIETSSEKGMISLNKSLADLVKRGEISLETAENFSLNPNELRLLTR